MPYKPGQSLAAKVDDALHGAAGIDLEIPGFLKRAGPVGNKTPADLAALAAIEAEQAARKSTKKSVQAERRKAKQAGDLKKMPLEGRAAIEYLKTGKRS